MSLFFPPEAIAYYHNHFSHTHQTADLETHLRVTLFAVPDFVGFEVRTRTDPPRTSVPCAVTSH